MILGAFCQLCLRVLRCSFVRKNSQWHSRTLTAFRQTFLCVPATIKELKKKVRIAINLSDEAWPTFLKMCGVSTP